MFDHWITYIVLGLICGSFGSMLGVGGGVILVPALVILLHFPQKSAQGTSLAMMVSMAFVGAMRYHMNPAITLNPKVILLLSAGAVAGALVGPALAGAMPVVALRRIFAVVLIVAAYKMLMPVPQPAKPAPAQEIAAQTTPAPQESPSGPDPGSP